MKLTRIIVTYDYDKIAFIKGNFYYRIDSSIGQLEGLNIMYYLYSIFYIFVLDILRVSETLNLNKDGVDKV
jgi:hypothetical protein